MFTHMDTCIIGKNSVKHNYQKKKIFTVTSIGEILLIQITLSRKDFVKDLSLFGEILCNMSTAIVCSPGCGVVNFEIIFLIFLIRPFFYLTKMSRQKFWEWKELLRWNKNHFSSFLKGSQLSKVVSDQRVRF